MDLTPKLDSLGNWRPHWTDRMGYVSQKCHNGSIARRTSGLAKDLDMICIYCNNNAESFATRNARTLRELEESGSNA